MKYVKRPLFNICRCDRCGTVIQPEAGDDFYYEFDDLDPLKIKRVRTSCPVCNTYLLVTTVDEKGGE